MLKLEAADTNDVCRGVLPTEPGRDDVQSGGMGGGRGDYDQTSGGNKKGDSTMGKMMEKAGGLFKNEKMQTQGEEKRREAGGY